MCLMAADIVLRCTVDSLLPSALSIKKKEHTFIALDFTTVDYY